MSDKQKNIKRLQDAANKLETTLEILHNETLNRDKILEAVRSAQGATQLLVQIYLYLAGNSEPKEGE
jgi:hypothetical protein